MAWNTPRTWSPGETVTAALMNTQIRDNLNVLKTTVNDDGTPLLRAVRYGANALAGSGYFVWDVNLTPSGADASGFTRQNSNQEVKVSTAGIYLVSVNVELQSLTSAQTDIRLRAGVGGGNLMASAIVGVASGYASCSFTGILQLAADALLAVDCVAGSRFGDAGGAPTHISVMRLR